MTPLRAVGVVGLVLAASFVWIALGASADWKAQEWLFIGLVPCGCALAALPLGIAIDLARPQWIAASTRAFEGRRTAVMLVGSGLLIVSMLLVGGAFEGNKSAGFAMLALVYVHWTIGFAATARGMGLRLLRRTDGDAGGPAPLIWGWIARSALIATPLLWPTVLGYVLVTSLGAPVVGWLDRHRDALAAAANSD